MTKEKLIKELIDEGYLKTPKLIDVFRVIDRRDFVTEDMKDLAYVNNALPIGYGQTISQPLTVAFMLELLEPKAGEKILDIGAGSGWTAALLAQIVGGEMSGGKIIGVERIPELKTFAEENVRKYNFGDKGIIKIIEGDGSLGFPEEAPYDKIIAAATAREIPSAWKEQLKIGGKIVAPVGQSIIMLEKTGQNQFSEKSYFGFAFVPLVGDL